MSDDISMYELIEQLKVENKALLKEMQYLDAEICELKDSLELHKKVSAVLTEFVAHIRDSN